MKNRMHVVALILFVVCFLYDVVVWGSVPALPKVGPLVAESAEREAPLATAYIAIGGAVTSAVPPLRTLGTSLLTDAWSEGFERIRDDPTVAMDLIFHSHWNASNGWLRMMYWATPVLLLATLIFWLRRPKPVQALRR